MYLLADLVAILKENVIIQEYSNFQDPKDSSEDEVKKTFDQQCDLCKIQKLVNQLPTDFRNAVFKQNNKKSEDDLFLNELKKIKRNYSDENNNISKKVENRLSSCGSFRITDTFVKEKRLLFNSNTCKTADSLRVQLPSSMRLEDLHALQNDEMLPATRKNYRLSSKNSANTEQRTELSLNVPIMEAGRVELSLEKSSSSTFQHKTVTAKNAVCKEYFDIKEFLAGGRFGHVYRCVEKSSGLELAAKCMRCKKSVSPKTRTSAKKCPIRSNMIELEPVNKDDVLLEIALMNRLNHRNIIKLYDAFSDGDTMTLIFEYLCGGELLDRILEKETALTEFDAVFYARQIVDVVDYLHKHFILHLDLKPENILCTCRSSRHIKIIDFGFARRFTPDQSLHVEWGTPHFMAPETLKDHVATSATDMWSIGVICYVMLSGLSPFHGQTISEVVDSAIKCEWDFNDRIFDSLTRDGKDFISKLLVKRESDRMSATECLHHPWLTTPLSGEKQKNANEGKSWKDSCFLIRAVDWIKQRVPGLKAVLESLKIVESLDSSP